MTPRHAVRVLLLIGPALSVLTTLLALYVGGRRSTNDKAASQRAAITRFVAEMRHNAVLHATNARLVHMAVSSDPAEGLLPAHFPLPLSDAALLSLPDVPLRAITPVKRKVRDPRSWLRRTPRPNQMRQGEVLYLAGLRLALARWNAVVQSWYARPDDLLQEGVRQWVASAYFASYMELAQIAPFLPDSDRDYVLGLATCSDAVAEIAIPTPA